MQACIVTCADKAFFGHLVRWTKRLTAIRLIDVSITILDCGLEPSQIAILQDLGAAVIPAEWDLKVPDRVPAFFKAMAIRPFLPQYCPDAEYLIWVDADCLVLRAEVIFDYVAAAASSDVACCVEVDRCYSSYYRRDYGQPAVYQSVNIISDVASYNAGFYEWHYDVDFAKFLRLSKQITLAYSVPNEPLLFGLLGKKRCKAVLTAWVTSSLLTLIDVTTIDFWIR